MWVWVRVWVGGPWVLPLRWRQVGAPGQGRARWARPEAPPPFPVRREALGGSRRRLRGLGGEGWGWGRVPEGGDGNLPVQNSLSGSDITESSRPSCPCQCLCPFLPLSPSLIKYAFI